MSKSLLALLILAAAPVVHPLSAQQGPIPGPEDLQDLLARHAHISLAPPPGGYHWEPSDISGTPESGSVRVTNEKMIYFFLHWGPTEVPVITEEWVRERVPQVWPSEGLQVVATRPTTVAGHPGILAEVVPARGFYSARFLLWNCPETGRLFIADMNFNTDLRTPKREIDAQVRAVEETLACHDGAPRSELETHPVSADLDHYGIRLDHPSNWYFFDNPFSVPFSAYEGVRDQTIGSVLGWPIDQAVEIRFMWNQRTASTVTDEAGMGGSRRAYALADSVGSELWPGGGFHAEGSEMVSIAGHEVFKLLGRYALSPEDGPASDPMGRPSPSGGRTMVAVLEELDSRRRLIFTVSVPDYQVEGQGRVAPRWILDRWVHDLVSGLPKGG